ncbi:MAG: RNA-binding S4 domain-containing protein [Gemmatimonadales bacterium]
MSDQVRLDKWLWAARFFKTRALAAAAIEKGRVEVNGERAKRARHLHPGDRVRIRLGPYAHDVEVLELASVRGPATRAALLYRETDDSRKARAALALQLRSAPDFDFAEGKPDKKQRRMLRRLKGSEE